MEKQEIKIGSQIWFESKFQKERQICGYIVSSFTDIRTEKKYYGVMVQALSSLDSPVYSGDLILPKTNLKDFNKKVKEDKNYIIKCRNLIILSESEIAGVTKRELPAIFFIDIFLRRIFLALKQYRDQEEIPFNRNDLQYIKYRGITIGEISSNAFNKRSPKSRILVNFNPEFFRFREKFLMPNKPDVLEIKRHKELAIMAEATILHIDECMDKEECQTMWPEAGRYNDWEKLGFGHLMTVKAAQAYIDNYNAEPQSSKSHRDLVAAINANHQKLG